jgi:hypothetical protein
MLMLFFCIQKLEFQMSYVSGPVCDAVSGFGNRSVYDRYVLWKLNSNFRFCYGIPPFVEN